MGLNAIPREQIGYEDDGTTPRYNYRVPDGVEHVVATGPAMGLVQLKDGTTYDVTDHFIAVEEKHATEVAHHIDVQIERTGRFNTTDPKTGAQIPFRHTDCDHCDAPKTLHLEDPEDRNNIAQGRVKAKKGSA